MSREELVFFATAAKGTEPAVRDELRERRFRGVRADRGGVHFSGSLYDGFRACLELRCAVRVLQELATFDAPNPDALYAGIQTIEWSRWLSPERTLAVRAYCRQSSMVHTQYVAQRTKDAVVDQQRARDGVRSSVDLVDPDVQLFVHLVNDHATVHLDLSGEPLHRRGYRPKGAPAPLKETLAAAIVRLSRWDRRCPLVDPMCGTGTLAVEAAMLAHDVAPGLFRPRFGFERWASHDDSARRFMGELRASARARIQRAGPEVLASDVDDAALEAATVSAKRAGVPVEVKKRSVGRLTPFAEGGQILVNPPYGERVDDDPETLRELGRALKRMHRHHAAVLAGSPRIRRAIPLRPVQELTLFNGALECRLLRFEID